MPGNIAQKDGTLKQEGVLTMGPVDPERKSTAKAAAPIRVDSKIVLTLPGLVVREENWDYGGNIRKRQVIQVQDSAAILPINSRGNIILLDQFRIPTRDGEHWLIEAVAGKLDMEDGKWEDPKNTASRELKEELGYTAKALIPYPSYYTTPGKLSEKQFPFVARGLTEGESHLELGEVFRDIKEVTPLEARTMDLSGAIMDLKTQNLIRGYLLELIAKNAKRIGVEVKDLLRPEIEA
jgi:ADP-ribose pyrophosphatase